jgi:K+-sensing histidine kinase KdpD
MALPPGVDWFFVQPYHQFTVSDPGEWLSLLLFLLTALVTGQLAADQRRRAREAYQREREAVVLYDGAVARRRRSKLTAGGRGATPEGAELDGVAIEVWR